MTKLKVWGRKVVEVGSACQRTLGASGPYPDFVRPSEILKRGSGSAGNRAIDEAQPMLVPLRWRFSSKQQPARRRARCCCHA